MSDNRNPIQRKGSFKCISRAVDVFTLLLILGLILIAVVYFLSLFNFGKDKNEHVLLCGAVLFVVEGTLAAVRVMLTLGREYDYAAGEKDFTITAPDGSKEYFYYSDVSEVNYTPIYKKKLLAGYVTDITTGARTVRYRFFFGPNAENTSTAATPFYILEVNSGLREPEPEDKNSEKIIEEFARMQLRQSIALQKTSREGRESQFWDSIEDKMKFMKSDSEDDE